jgi:hypothetical protein
MEENKNLAIADLARSRRFAQRFGWWTGRGSRTGPL